MKHYHFCPQGPLKSTEKESSLLSLWMQTCMKEMIRWMGKGFYREKYYLLFRFYPSTPPNHFHMCIFINECIRCQSRNPKKCAWYQLMAKPPQQVPYSQHAWCNISGKSSWTDILTGSILYSDLTYPFLNCWKYAIMCKSKPYFFLQVNVINWVFIQL